MVTNNAPNSKFHNEHNYKMNVWLNMNTKVNFFWFRRDLRIHDNAGLYHALKSGNQVVGLFIFDTEILDKLEEKKDARVTFLHDMVNDLATEIRNLGGQMIIKYGNPESVWQGIINTYEIDQVFTNRDYEPYALDRDRRVKELLFAKRIGFNDYKDHVIFERDEVTKGDASPYMVFTPYSRKWKAKLGDYKTSYFLKAYPNEKYQEAFRGGVEVPDVIPTLNDMGFQRSEVDIPSKESTVGIIKNYHKTRNYPSVDGTSKLGIHFRFGTVSIRSKAKAAFPLNETYVNELIWRDFYSMILQHFPHVAENAFRAKYEAVQWVNNEEHFKAWCEGRTGYPLVDAGMRELNQTGHMHNRVRMVTASFLTKHLLTDWRWGEAYFAQKLLDFDLASNNGGWQWAAGCGTDAAPYFRIFNPTNQQIKFDKDFKYIKKYVPEFGTDSYVDPIVDHREARERCLSTYKAALNQA